MESGPRSPAPEGVGPGWRGTDPLVSVVVPVHDEQSGLAALHVRLGEALAAVPAASEIVYVDDGSSDRSTEIVRAWAQAGEAVLVRLSRNFGMEAAMSAGLDVVQGDWVVLMHADLQDPPELIGQMLELAGQGADVVYARRIGRDESRVKRVLATGFYALMRRLARVPYQGQAGDFRLLSRRVVEVLREMPERRRFLRGMVAWVGYEQVPIEYHRAGRSSGRGASYPQLFRLAAEAIVAFSDVPLVLATYFGTLTALLSGVAALVLVILTATSAISASVVLWVLISVLFLGGVQLISIGILGSYLARVHGESLHRPLYLVDEVVDLRDAPRAPTEPAPSRGRSAAAAARADRP